MFRLFTIRDCHRLGSGLGVSMDTPVWGGRNEGLPVDVLILTEYTSVEGETQSLPTLLVLVRVDTFR